VDVKVIGLTGGIASGKSTVAELLRELGAPVVDADRIAREVVAPGSPALAELAARFGQEVLLADGTLDRKRMADVVFSDDEARRALNAITHPRIAARSRAAIDEHAAAGEPVVVYEAALIVENRLHEGMAGLIVVEVPQEVQLARLIARDGLSEAAARARIAAQLPSEARRRAATWVVDNTGPIEHTRAQVEAIWTEIRGQG
jgi:dephospho-CoA kinase